MFVNTLAPQSPPPIKTNQLNPTTIPNPNRLLAVLIIVDEGEGSELRSNEQDIAVLTLVPGTNVADFKGYYEIFLEDSKSVKTIIDNLNAEFGHYKHFPQLDSSSALLGFYDICGGEDDTAGHLKAYMDWGSKNEL